MPLKIILGCRKCHRNLPRSAFDSRNDGSDRVHLRCRDCRREIAPTTRGMTDEERYWFYARPSDGCWGWASYTSHGYARVLFQGRVEGAHRVSWILHHGPIPEGLFVLHRCDNPPCTRAQCDVPGCEHLKESVECESHLFLGTDLDNIQDKVEKNRQRKGATIPQAKLTEEGVRDIRRRVARGETGGSVARLYGVSIGTVSMIVHRKRWHHIY
jgi:hypothetical protein